MGGDLWLLGARCPCFDKDGVWMGTSPRLTSHFVATSARLFVFWFRNLKGSETSLGLIG